MAVSPAEKIDSYLCELPGGRRRLSETEWGLTLDSAGWPLDVGLALRDGLFRIQASVCGPDRIAEGTLLWWNKQLPLVRFSATKSGDVWICCDLPVSSVDARQLDRVLGLVVLTATQARQQALPDPRFPAAD